MRQYVDEPTDDPVTLRIYPRQDGEFVLYEDDGVTLDYVAGNATWTRFVCKDSDRKLIIEPHEKSTIKTVEPSRFDVLLVSEGLHKLDRIPGRATSSEILTFRGYLEIQ
ncbi:MAG: DUF5110 domain-containing protein [Ignavibacteria bacterium]|nr:DUF5110 domain-containing protein [Ignavibacteria bacterium]